MDSDGKIKNLRVDTGYCSRLVDELGKEPTSKEDLIYKKYIELKTLKSVVSFLKEKKINKEDGKRFSTDDVSNILQTEHVSISQVIIQEARKIFKSNKSSFYKNPFRF